jgi:hypothetical protein
MAPTREHSAEMPIESIRENYAFGLQALLCKMDEG